MLYRTTHHHLHRHLHRHWRHGARGYIHLSTIVLLIVLGYAWYHFNQGTAEKAKATASDAGGAVSATASNATQSIAQKLMGLFDSVAGQTPAAGAAISPTALDSKTNWRAMAKTLSPATDLPSHYQARQSYAPQPVNSCETSGAVGETRQTPCKCFQVTMPDKVTGESVASFHCEATTASSYN